MRTLHFMTGIDAPVEKVWHTMLDDTTYRQWTKPFSEGGYYKGNWEKGSKMQFLGPDPETGKAAGMVSRIAENKHFEYISIEHLGIIKDGKEDTTSEFARKWAPAFENYTFVKKNGGTELHVDMDANENEAKMFEEMWPKALKELKRIAEK